MKYNMEYNDQISGTVVNNTMNKVQTCLFM